jgi:hypothetical protein
MIRKTAETSSINLKCTFCGSIVTTGVPECTIVRGLLMCPECFIKIPEDVVEMLGKKEATNE